MCLALPKSNCPIQKKHTSCAHMRGNVHLPNVGGKTLIWFCWIWSSCSCDKWVSSFGMWRRRLWRSTSWNEKKDDVMLHMNKPMLQPCAHSIKVKIKYIGIRCNAAVDIIEHRMYSIVFSRSYWFYLNMLFRIQRNVNVVQINNIVIVMNYYM